MKERFLENVYSIGIQLSFYSCIINEAEDISMGDVFTT